MICIIYIIYIHNVYSIHDFNRTSTLCLFPNRRFSMFRYLEKIGMVSSGILSSSDIKSCPLKLFHPIAVLCGIGKNKAGKAWHLISLEMTDSTCQPWGDEPTIKWPCQEIRKYCSSSIRWRFFRATLVSSGT